MLCSLKILPLFAALFYITLFFETATEYCSYESGCDSCCNGYCCSYSSYSLGAGYIILIVALVALKVFFWVFVCYRCNRRRQATIILTGPPAGNNTTVVNTSHVVSPGNPNHAGYIQQGQQQQWFQPMPQVQPQANQQATPSNSQAPPPYSTVQQQGVNQNVIPV